MQNLLLINTTKFLLVSFVLLCLYELVVYCYFRFVKDDGARLSKNESRKRKEMAMKPQPQAEVRKATVVTSVYADTSKGNDWESLIGYKRGVSTCEKMDNKEANCADEGKRFNDENLSLLEDLMSSDDGVQESAATESIVNCVDSGLEKSDSGEDATQNVNMPSQENVRKFFSEFDFSNMVE